eukprot:TRINITY_DN9271_c0_g1_i1.p1 TRINITY_DN9271_c0_g1~~TRINITY_DN9271_c0_g1_i1.p1  ORF type:complete len:168 (-),score=25.66 TRINITY_DN9271_c0_g1_i1:130-633(-)
MRFIFQVLLCVFPCLLFFGGLPFWAFSCVLPLLMIYVTFLWQTFTLCPKIRDGLDIMFHGGEVKIPIVEKVRFWWWKRRQRKRFGQIAESLGHLPLELENLISEYAGVPEQKDMLKCDVGSCLALTGNFRFLEQFHKRGFTTLKSLRKITTFSFAPYGNQRKKIGTA